MHYDGKRCIIQKTKEEVYGMAVEYELKFRAKPKQLQAILSAYPGEHPQFDMVTTYYDTPSGALSARHYALRHRIENENHVCTLKTPAVGNGRNEREIPCENIETALATFCEQVADLSSLVRDGLIAVCGAKFHRIAISVMFGDCRLELALDEGILTGGGKEIPLCEVEVELKGGNPKDADMFALILANQYQMNPEAKSKFKRSLELYQSSIDR